MPKNAEKPSVEHVIPDHLQILSQQFMRFGQHLRTKKPELCLRQASVSLGSTLGLKNSSSAIQLPKYNATHKRLCES